MMKERQSDILVVGGGLGGIAGALAALRMGRRVVLAEETDWLGGQLTAQAVPPDEHPWIEGLGCTASYRHLREGIRDYYRNNYPLTSQARANLHLNPGQGTVSRLCHEPRVALAVVEGMLAAYRSSGQLTILLNHRPIAAETGGDRVRAVTLHNDTTGEKIVIHAPYVLDATELGDLLSLAGVEYVSGAESQDAYGEPHAVAGPAEPDNVQAITWCFPVAYEPTPGADYTIARPEQYDFWRDHVPKLDPVWPQKKLSWGDPHPPPLKPDMYKLFPGENDRYPLWTYRRIVYSGHYPAGTMPHEVTLVNWTQNDYWQGNIIDKPADEVQKHLHAAKQLSLSLLYWLQTEAGYPGLHLRPDITGTEDGLAKYPYIRESRRIRAVFTVTENHIGTAARGGMEVGWGERAAQPPGLCAKPFDDTVGIGAYRIDLHPTTGGNHSLHISSLPFQIPLGALIPVRVENLLPANKNIGTTHLTNGCYRLHPVEWNIGEAAGALAAFCLERDLVPRQVCSTESYLKDFQRMLVETFGFELEWPYYARVTPL